MSQYKGWSISVTPARAYMPNRWGARVEVWPPDRAPDKHAGVRVHFGETASDREAIQQAATTAARRYIDASRAVHQ